jgi:hypothetical protein
MVYFLIIHPHSIVQPEGFPFKHEGGNMFKKAVFILTWLSASAALNAQMPTTFIFETFIADPSTGNPMTGTRNMRFVIYDSPTGGDPVSEAEEHTVTLHEGWIHVLLTCPPLWKTNRYVGICLLPNPVELSPRFVVYPAPYSYVSSKVESTNGTSSFYRGTGIRLSDVSAGYEPENPPQGMLTLQKTDYVSPDLIGLRSISGPLIEGWTSRSNAVTIQTGAGIAIIGRSSNGWVFEDNPANETVPGTGVKGEGKDFGGYFVGGYHSSPYLNIGTGGYFEGPRYAAQFKGKVHAKGDYTREYGSGDETRAMPIAYGNVQFNGNLASGTPNLKTKWDEVRRCYLITIAHETVTAAGFVTAITPVQTMMPGGHEPLKPVLFETSAGNGKLMVKFYNSAGRAVRHGFQFVTYKP